MMVVVMMTMISSSWESCFNLLRKMHLSGLLRIFVASVWTKASTRMQAPDPNSIAHESRLFTVFSKTAKEWYLSVHHSFSLHELPQFAFCFRRVPHTTVHCEPARNVLLAYPFRCKKSLKVINIIFSLSFSSILISVKTQFLLGSIKAWGLATESNTQQVPIV